MNSNQQVCTQYIRKWPREIFDAPLIDGSKTQRMMAKTLDVLTKPGVYILYRGDEPRYIGRANRLRRRLTQHAQNLNSRYHDGWDCFSAFLIGEEKHRMEIEAILIASMPTAANGARPKIRREKLPADVVSRIKEIRRR